jgi:hypothetical protein
LESLFDRNLDGRLGRDNIPLLKLSLPYSLMIKLDEIPILNVTRDFRLPCELGGVLVIDRYYLEVVCPGIRTLL